MGILKSLLALSLAAAAVGFCDEKQQPPEKPFSPSLNVPTVPAYNAPARVETQNSQRLFTDISFNFWQPTQENMELGVFDNGAVSSINFQGLTIVGVASSDSFSRINMSFDFKPGFTLGLGCNLNDDGWDARLAYTWFHSTHKKSTTAANFILFNTSSQGIIPTWGAALDGETHPLFQTVQEKWKLCMDLVDLDIGRWFFVGKKLTFHPALGARAAIIQQKVNLFYNFGFANFLVNLPGLVGSGTLVEDKEVSGKSSSWGLGPKFALEMDWELRDGFRLFGNGEVDLLYTRYTSLRERTVTDGTALGTINLIPFNFALFDERSSRQKNVNSLRTHLDLELGIGWGRFFNEERAHFDFMASYAFQVFFDQNMFRHSNSDRNHFMPNGNLYIQGLVAKARFDF